MTVVHDAFLRDLPFTYWRGIRMQKNPCDLQLFAEVIWETKPRLIIETGSGEGGSALFFADMLRLTQNQWAGVFSIDNDYKRRPEDKRVGYVRGDSATYKVDTLGVDRIMVVLDSDHSEQHVARELDHLAPLVTPGCYLVVEDTSHTGAGDAVEDWLPAHPEFIVVNQSRYLCTFNTWLKRA